MDIQAVATSQGLQILKNNLHGKVKQFVLLGDDSTDNGVLDKLLQSNSSTYEQIKESVIFKGEVSKAYSNDQGLLIFELILPYQDDLNKYVYGIGLIDDENTLISITKIPKFNKKRGIGGTFIYKVLISGELGKIIFTNETKVAFATDEECQKGELRHKAVDSYQLKRATVAEAVKLHNARKINGVDFDGTKDITVKAEASGGNAATATRLQTPRKINGTLFDGARDINIDIAKTFASHHDTQGWVRLPTGLLLQWGVSSAFAGGSHAVMLPVVFPHAALVASVTPYGDFLDIYPTDNNSYFGCTLDTSSIVIYNRMHTGVAYYMKNFYWIAIGF